MMAIRNYIIICFNTENIYKLQDAAASEIKPQEKCFSISHTHLVRKFEHQKCLY